MITPLFALDAEDLYDAGQFTDAVALCRKGLELYPEYASGYAVLYRSLIALEHNDDALSAIHRGLQAMPANRILIRLATEHEQMMKQSALASLDEHYDLPTVVDEIVSEETLTAMSNDIYAEQSNIEEPVTLMSKAADENDYGDNAEFSRMTDGEAVTMFSEEESNIVISDALDEQEGENTSYENVSTSAKVEDAFVAKRVSTTPLRVIDSAEDVDKVMIRASSVGLIPGLQFAPVILRSVSPKTRDTLPKLPPFKQIAPRFAPKAKHRTPLEELAARLEKARISIVHEEHVPSSSSGNEIVSTATETVAKIYESQGAYALSVKVYQQLARSKPEFREEYEAKIRELHQKIEEKKQSSSSR